MEDYVCSSWMIGLVLLCGSYCSDGDARQFAQRNGGTESETAILRQAEAKAAANGGGRTDAV